MRHGPSLAIVTGGAALLVAHALYLRGLFDGNALDDAYISYRYAENLARGLGLVFNAGERVEGYSNFLWTVLLAPVAAQGGDLVLVSQILGVGCSVGALVLAVVALRRVLGVRQVLSEAFLVLLLATSGYLAAWSVGGLEGPLYGLLLLAAWVAFASRRILMTAVLLSALALLRPEGIVVAIVATGLAAWVALRQPQERRLWVLVLVVAGVVLVYEAWRFAFYGPHLWPNAVRAKVGWSLAQLGRGGEYVAGRFLLPYAPLLLPLVFVRGWREAEPGVRQALGLGFALFVGCLALIVGAGGDWSQGRFFAPLVPLGGTLAVGWASQTWARRPPRGVARVLLAVGALAFLVGAAITSTSREAKIRRQYAEVDSERIAIGRWFAQHMPPDAVVAVHAAGQIPYYSRLPTHDMLGLNDPHIAALRVAGFGRGDPGHEKFDPEYTLRTVRPGIIVEGRRIPGLVRHALYRSEYYPFAGFWKHHEIAVRRELAVRLGLLPGTAPQAAPGGVDSPRRP